MKKCIICGPDRAFREKIIKNGFETAQQWKWEPSIDRLEKYFQDILTGNRLSKIESLVNVKADRAISLAHTLFRNEVVLSDRIQTLNALLADKDRQLLERDSQLSAIYNSFSWRLVQPLRKMLVRSRGTWLELLWLFLRGCLKS